MSYHSDDYNPRFGFGRLGRVNKDDFSIDGKSWEYRNPTNYNDNDSGWSNYNDKYNNNASAVTNPLYDYDYGTVRDAAKKLGIGNVDEKAEVDQLLKYIQEEPEKEVEPKIDPDKFLDDYKEEIKPVIDEIQEEETPSFIPAKISQGAKGPMISMDGFNYGNDGGITAPIAQDNDFSFTGNNSGTIDTDNSVKQMINRLKSGPILTPN